MTDREKEKNIVKDIKVRNYLAIFYIVISVGIIIFTYYQDFGRLFREKPSNSAIYSIMFLFVGISVIIWNRYVLSKKDRIKKMAIKFYDERKKYIREKSNSAALRWTIFLMLGVTLIAAQKNLIEIFATILLSLLLIGCIYIMCLIYFNKKL
ncbi:MAG: hypothetical protein ABII85_01395 [Bacillota bacterium]